MAVAFRANGHAAFNATSGTATLPAGLTAGDFMLMAASVTSSSGAVSTPTGWTALSSSPSSLGGFGSAERLYAFFRVAGSSEAAPSVTVAPSSHFQVDIMAFTGVRAVSPVDANAVGTWTANASSAHYVHPSVTTTLPNDGVILLKLDSLGGTTTVSSAPAGYSQIAAPAGDGLGSFTALLGSQALAGATGTLDVTYSSVMGAVGFTVAVVTPQPGKAHGGGPAAAINYLRELGEL